LFAGESFGLQTRVATTVNASLRRADEKVTAFVELESAIRARGELL
jgi:hypothetical protein